ncbi:ATP-binding cassette-type vacuolar membrane transporter Hmt1 [Pestalotiopsis sp. IQ-011]
MQATDEMHFSEPEWPEGKSLEQAADDGTQQIYPITLEPRNEDTEFQKEMRKNACEWYYPLSATSLGWLRSRVRPIETKNFRTGEQNTWTGSFTRAVSPKGFFIDLRFPERDVSSYPPKLDRILSKLWKQPCTPETSEKPCTIWGFAGFRSPDKPIPQEYMRTGLVEFQAYSKWCVRKLHEMPCSSKYQVAMKGSTHLRVKNWKGDFSLEDENLLASAQKMGGFVAVLNPRGVHRDVGPFPLWDEILAESTAKDDRGIVIRVGRLMVGLFISGAGKMGAFKILYDREGQDYNYVFVCGAESKLQSKAESNFPVSYFEYPFCQWRVGELELIFA